MFGTSNLMLWIFWIPWENSSHQSLVCLHIDSLHLAMISFPPLYHYSKLIVRSTCFTPVLWFIQVIYFIYQKVVCSSNIAKLLSSYFSDWCHNLSNWQTCDESRAYNDENNNHRQVGWSRAEQSRAEGWSEAVSGLLLFVFIVWFSHKTKQIPLS